MSVRLIDEHVEETNNNYIISLDTELITVMYRAFANITYLNLTFNVNNMAGLNCVFENMTNLVFLQIYLKGNLNDYSSDLFDSVVLSLPLTLLTTVKEYGEHIENVEFKRYNKTSIKNLSGKY